jgi:hypothetical protein
MAPTKQAEAEGRATLTPTSTRRTTQRMARYSLRELDSDDSSKETTTDLLITRGGEETEIKLTRLSKGRTTEIGFVLGDEERRDLARLLA